MKTSGKFKGLNERSEKFRVVPCLMHIQIKLLKNHEKIKKNSENFREFKGSRYRELQGVGNFLEIRRSYKNFVDLGQYQQLQKGSRYIRTDQRSSENFSEFRGSLDKFRKIQRPFLELQLSLKNLFESRRSSEKFRNL